MVRPAGFEPAAYGFEEQESWNLKNNRENNRDRYLTLDTDK